MNTIRQLSTPIESCMGTPYFAVLTLETDTVYIYETDSNCFLDRFTWEEWCELIDCGTLNKESKRLAINW